MHTVFPTNERKPFLRDNVLRENLRHHTGGIPTHLECRPITHDMAGKMDLLPSLASR